MLVSFFSPNRLAVRIFFVLLSSHFTANTFAAKNRRQIMKKEKKVVVVDVKTEEPKKVSKTLEAARRLKGHLIVNDPAFLL